MNLNGPDPITNKFIFTADTAKTLRQNECIRNNVKALAIHDFEDNDFLSTLLRDEALPPLRALERLTLFEPDRELLSSFFGQFGRQTLKERNIC